MRTRQENPIPGEIAKPAWPQGKRFAFTIVDDTDRSTVENVGPVYDFLLELGLRTTKTIWPLAPLGPPRSSGQSLEDPDYRPWVPGLKDLGFEIALHGASDETSTRERVLRGLNYFREVIGQDPRLHANHTGQVESIYWGRARLDGVPKVISQWARRLTKGEDQFHGHREAPGTSVKSAGEAWPVYLGRMPEPGQETLSRQLTALIEDMLRQWTGPSPRLA